MATSDTELKSEVRVFTDYTTAILDSDELDTVIERAKRHIRSAKGIDDSGFAWYDTVHRENALFWWSCLFAKVVVGELDSQTIQVGAIDIDTLLANDDGTVTTWFRNATKAMRQIDSGGDYPFGTGITSPIRDNRTYGGDGTGDSDLDTLNE